MDAYSKIPLGGRWFLTYFLLSFKMKTKVKLKKKKKRCARKYLKKTTGNPTSSLYVLIGL
jgi:hypothetical protein